MALACSPDTLAQDESVRLSVLTLNLHAYQQLRTEGVDEAQLTDQQAAQRVRDYAPIFERIASGIDELDPDVICLQEVGEWAGGRRDEPASVSFGATDSNMVRQVLSRLRSNRYRVSMDWSHYAWDAWLEGSAVLSKHPIVFSESRFISGDETARYESWKSRNVPMATIDVPGVGGVAVFSVHAGWWDDAEEPARAQFERLLSWAKQPDRPAHTTVLCGDFNAPATGPGYRFLTTRTGFADQYALANPAGMFDATIAGGEHGWEQSGRGERIDYIFMNDDSPLQVTRAERVFTATRLGRVSDHVGIYAEFSQRTGGQ
jgi:maltose 6'-phosphate phosphatase